MSYGEKRTATEQAGEPELTPLLVLKISDGVAFGLPLERAAALQGVPRNVVHRWLAKGAEGVEPYVTFARMIEDGLARLQRRALDLFWQRAKPRDILSLFARWSPKCWSEAQAMKAEPIEGDLARRLGSGWMAALHRQQTRGPVPRRAGSGLAGSRRVSTHKSTLHRNDP